MFVAGLFTAVAVHLPAARVSDWVVMIGMLVGVSLGLMLIPSIAAVVRAAMRKSRQQAQSFAPSLWAVWGIFAFSYVFSGVFNLRLDLLACQR
jgi:amino acid permease